ncbi:2-isopropylmalate synthase [Labilithrix luteola]|uniref:2-isopropylmalate synthase n=1 Tax=Labilithrix luteola TaxID=1391654 RepID=A0A0K1PSH3_9BACT|nr:LeuA family protein [Labilithrix luteola]AKU96472.1 2-isopropylmalate synthase [Labilithrix luteola]
MSEFATERDRAADLIFDWNEVNRKGRILPKNATFFDETLRDGLQNPSVVDPSIDDKLKLLFLMEELGIHMADIGLPGSSPRAFEDCLRISKELTSAKAKLRVACAGRTVVSDITPMIELSQRAGVPIDVYAFIGSSPIRQYAESWDVGLIAQRSAEAIDIAVKAGLEVTYVTEDTTRSRPDVLTTLFRAAIDHGASRICLSDTVGHATPDGVRNLIQFTKNVIAGTGRTDVGIDWHGHNDRGLALENALWAFEYGADRVHATGLGVGERVGNAPMELMLLNLKLLGQLDEGHDLTKLLEYSQLVSKALHWGIPINYPLVGRDAFRTATGVHAAAIIKSIAKGDRWLADRIYSGVPAGMIGRTQEICIGFMSGASNVNFWLALRNIPSNERLVSEILRTAKGLDRIMTDDEVMAVVERVREAS